jgi:phosphoribosylformylglycinamidine cyclo-ligase
MKRSKQSVYEQRGVSSTKSEVHKAISKLDKGLFPEAFCKVLPDVLGGSSKHCNVLHADTAGTKAGLAWLAWMETRDLQMVRGIGIDALVMNIDDVGCIGGVDHLVFNQTIGRNKFLVSGEVIQAIIEGTQEFCGMLQKEGIDCQFAGGETADVGDIVRTLDVGSSLVARLPRKDVIDASRMAPGDFIVGFSSTGKARWERTENSGIGANGLTNARHDTLIKSYRQYRETYAPQQKKNLVYRGKWRLAYRLPDQNEFSIAEALLSPTRTYLPIIKMILKEINRKYIHGIIHCSGGGQTKIGKFGRPGNSYVKNALLPIPPIFKFLQEVSGLPWKEMYQTYNMGHRLEIVVPHFRVAEVMISMAAEVGIRAEVVGDVRKNKGKTSNVVIQTNDGTFTY